MMPASAASISYSNISLMFGAGLLALWLLLSGHNIKELSSRAITSLSGHLRARPDLWLECALRDAFAKFDRELAAILHDRDVPLPPSIPNIPNTRPCRDWPTPGPASPRGQEDPPGHSGGVTSEMPS